MGVGFFFDMTKCIGCRTCEIACKDINDLESGLVFRRVRSFECGEFPTSTVFHHSSSCNHCANAACVRACPMGALTKSEEGVTIRNQASCIACMNCAQACPYDVPQLSWQRKAAAQCDTCLSLRSSGFNPACVDACHMRCLHFGDIEHGIPPIPQPLVRDAPFLPPSDATDPSFLIHPHARYQEAPREFAQ